MKEFLRRPYRSNGIYVAATQKWPLKNKDFLSAMSPQTLLCRRKRFLCLN